MEPSTTRDTAGAGRWADNVARLPSISRALLDNRANFDRSGAPSRVMYFDGGDGGWTDFPAVATEAFRAAFAARTPTVRLDMGGLEYAADFLRMLLVGVTEPTEQSLAWIDVEGRCFFPKHSVCFGRNGAAAQPPPVAGGRVADAVVLDLNREPLNEEEEEEGEEDDDDDDENNVGSLGTKELAAAALLELKKEKEETP